MLHLFKPKDGKNMRMRRTMAALAVSVLLLACYTLSAYGLTPESEIEDAVSRQADGIFIPSGRYAGPEPESGTISNRHSTEGFDRLAASGDLVLYARSDNMVFLVEDTRSGYLWSSAPAQDDYDPKDYNKKWLGKLISPFIMTYLNRETNAKTEVSLTGDDGLITGMEEINGGMRYSMFFKKAEISFDFEIYLDEGGLVVRIPDASIREEGKYAVVSFQLLPYWGAIPDADIPGYLFVPDGPGALIRFQDEHNFYEEGYTASVYGEDYAVNFYDYLNAQASPSSVVCAPVFGMVHGSGQNGWFAVIEDGKYDAQITAVPSGVSTPFNTVSARFMLRNTYFSPTNKSGDGYNTYQKERIHTDMSIRYLFLTGAEADYTGMADIYRKYLLDRGGLPASGSGSDNIPLTLSLIGAVEEPGFFAPRLVSLTSFERASDIVEDLHREGVDNISLRYLGWNNDGYSGLFKHKTSAESALGGNTGLKNFLGRMNELGVRVFLGRTSQISDGASGYSTKRDVVRLINNNIFKYEPEQYDKFNIYAVRGDVALQNAILDRKMLDSRFPGAGTALIDEPLISDFRESRITLRAEAADYQRKTAEALSTGKGLMADSPSEYLWPELTDILGLPMYSSQYVFFTDTVPFIQMVLHGHVSYASEVYNLSANSRELLLRMVEYGASPHFIITGEASWKMKDSLLSDICTSQYDVWRDEIIYVYNTVNDIIGMTAGREMTSHDVFSPGLIRVGYDDKMYVYVNYTNEDWSVDGLTVEARNCAFREQ